VGEEAEIIALPVQGLTKENRRGCLSIYITVQKHKALVILSGVVCREGPMNLLVAPMLPESCIGSFGLQKTQASG
jgi:hypothetical protein